MKQFRNHRTASDKSMKSISQNSSQGNRSLIEQQIVSQRVSDKKSQQFKALLLKNLTIQVRQPCTPVCSIITPIICIFFTILIRQAVLGVIPDPDQNFLVKEPMFPFLINNHDYDAFVSKYIVRNPLQWFQYDFENRLDQPMRQFVGRMDGSGKNQGMLANIPGQLNYKASFNSSIHQPHNDQRVFPPVFRCVQQMKANTSIRNKVGSLDSTQLNQEIFDRVLYLTNTSARELKNTTVKDVLSDGAMVFKKASFQGLEAEIKINDLRAFQYYRMSGVTLIGTRLNQTSKTQANFITTEGMLTLMDMLNVAFIKTVTGSKVASGYLYMPVHPEITSLIDMLINSIATILFPLSLSLLMPVFLYTIVLEKEEKLIQMMRMNGMGMASYWFNYFLFNFILSILANILFCTIGYIFLDDAFFKGTGLTVLAIVLLGWSLSQIGMAVFFQVFLASSMAANIVGYMISIWTNLIGATLSLALYQYPQKFADFFYFYPTFSFNRIFYLLFTECSSDHCVKTLADMSDQLQKCIIVLYVSFPVFFLIGIYLHQIVPQEYGVQQSVWFPFKKVTELFGVKKDQLKPFDAPQQDQSNEQDQCIDEQSIQQRVKVHKIQDPSGYALICSKLQKIYNNDKKAVSQLNLIVEDNQIFGLLGPNGAGKTTLISMLTGVFSPTKGSAYVGGYSILSEINKVHLAMGVCPQFDLLWPQLTVQQHLLFYARVKGVKGKTEIQRVNKTLKEVNLQQFRNFQARKLSGGMKRRLSVGISLVGNPRIVFLDQPTTGLDPENRRQLWEVLSKLKQSRSLFLTTHSMEEADTLCNRIAIITEGHLRTIGPQLMLKRKYGKGYFLTVTLQNQQQKLLGQVHSEHIKNNLHRFKYQESEYLPSGNLPMISESIAQSNFGVNADKFGSLVQQQYSGRESVMSDPNYKAQSQHQKDSFRIRAKQRQAEKVKNVKEVVHQLFPNAIIDREISGFLRFNLGSSIMVSQILEKIKECERGGLKYQKYKCLSQGWAVTNSTLQDVFMNVVVKYDKGDGQKSSLLSYQSINQKIMPQQMDSAQQMQENQNSSL